MQILNDEELVRKIKEENCSESLQILSERHGGIFYSTAKRYASRNPQASGITIEDFLENKHYIIFKAVSDFNPEKGAFVTWLGNKVKYFCLNTLEAEAKYYAPEADKFAFMVEHIPQPNYNPISDVVVSESEYILEILKQIKDKRIREIFQLRYFSENKKERAFSHIAKKLKMSTQGVIDLHNNFLDFMRRKIKATENMDSI